MTAPARDRDRIYRTEAIVLSRMEFGEADRILTIFTPRHGKLRVIAKGVRRPTSKLGPHLEYFTHSQLMMAKGRDLDLVTGAETLDPFLPIRSNLEALGHASHMAELLNRLTEERQENLRAFDLLVRSLRLLAEGVGPFAVTRHYEMALLGIVGFRPELYRCVQCSTDIQPTPNALSVRLGGMLCPACRSSDISARQLSINAQKYLRTLDRAGLGGAIALRIDESLEAEIEGALAAYIRHVAERDLSSLRVWRSMQEATPAAG
ncbi:MAG TPA: DNA repair protein RecO [Thermomicrobiales bacterium]|nr:DNA repair protein RecO [Thermomicrobiales bacterium]